jgi:hypothetical protein
MLAQPAGRPVRCLTSSYAHLLAVEHLIQRHGNWLAIPPRPFAVSANKHATPLRTRLSYLRRLIQPVGIEGTAESDDILASRRLAVR